jgi:type I restriction enzyme, S subunit
VRRPKPAPRRQLSEVYQAPVDPEAQDFVYPEPASPILTDLPTLPNEWRWGSLEMVAEIGSGIAVSRNRKILDSVEVPYLRVANVLRGHIDVEEVKTMRIEREALQRYKLLAGDVLFNEGGDRDKLGRGWVWEGQIENCVHQNHVFRARLIDNSLLNPRFVSHWGNTFGQSFFIEHATQTTNLASINRSVLGKLPIPIPSTAEQEEIMLVVERRLAAAAKLESTLERQLSRANEMRQLVLSDAFSGRLVSQDDEDEPAASRPRCLG